ncbi:hypothetical protein BVRB_1g009260 [Beta vulgaris subsp. vulgaris]|nr:hypothetical protein BVRB_1g009260 [Beta vulgaris subsp. vulgaris]
MQLVLLTIPAYTTACDCSCVRVSELVALAAVEG